MPETLVTERECDLRHDAVDKNIEMLQQNDKNRDAAYLENIKAMSRIRQALESMTELTELKIQTLREEIKREQEYGKKAGSHPRTMWENVKLLILAAIVSAATGIIVSVLF